jgi:putative addiction module component (TIGR02574 family)
MQANGARTMITVMELFGQAQTLPVAEREQLALMILEALPAENGVAIDLDPEDEAELERRLDSIKQGQAKGHNLESVMESIRTTLRK